MATIESAQVTTRLSIFSALAYSRFVIALGGVMLTLSLWVKKQQQLEVGCFSLVEPSAASQPGGCAALQQITGPFGISYPAMGYWFFLALAVLSLWVLIDVTAWRRVRRVVGILSIAGVAVSSHLLYVQISHKAFCLYCLSSAAMAMVLLAIHVIHRYCASAHLMEVQEKVRENGLGTSTAFGALGACLAIVNSAGGVQQDHGPLIAEKMDQLVVDAIKRISKGQAETKQPPQKLNMSEWTQFGEPFSIGDPNATVLAFLDPNCPHCYSAFTTLARVAERYKGRASIYVIARPLWIKSHLQVQALAVAKAEGKYMEMWRLQFERAKAGGLELNDLEVIFRDLGLTTLDVRERMAGELGWMENLTSRAKKASINSTPMIFVNGVSLTGSDRSEKGIEAALKNALTRRN